MQKMHATVLVIDDRQATLEVHGEAFGEAGATVVFAKSTNSAITTMSNSPSFDAVVSDLSFNEGGGEPNAEGEEVGRWIRSSGYPAYSVVCSARYNESDSEYRQAQEFFDDALSPKAKVADYQEIVRRAIENRKKRLSDSQLIASPELAKGRKNALQKIHTLDDPRSGSTNKDYFDQDFEIVVVQPVIESFVVGSPFFVWLKRLKEGVFLEVYGQPTLIGFGSNFDEAIGALNEVVLHTYLDLIDVQVAGPLLRVKNFLNAVYDDQVRASLGSDAGDVNAE